MDTPLTGVPETRSRVLDTLSQATVGLTLNGITERCGGATSQSSRVLVALETEGLVRFERGGWSLRPGNWNIWRSDERVGRADPTV